MKTTYSLSFYCRQSKSDRNGNAPVELSLCLNGKRCFINLPYKTRPAEFKRLMQSKKDNELKQYTLEIRNKFNSIQLDMMKKGIPITADLLKEYVKSGGVKSYTIDQLFADYFSILEKRVGHSLTKEVYEKYCRVRDLFYNHISKEREVSNITPAVIQDFYAKLQKDYQDSTSCGMMTKLKTVVKYAMDNGHLTINPFQNIKVAKGVKEITTITNSQLQALINHKFIPRVQRVADMFIFSCGSGLSYTDLAHLKKEDFVEKDGHLCIFKERMKTGVKFYSVLLPWAVEIAKKYDYEFSVLSNQKTNSYLQEIQDIMGIEVHLTFHKARHFYGMYLLNQQVPITTVQKALGHATLTQTQHYAKALEKTVIDDIAKVF